MKTRPDKPYKIFTIGFTRTTARDFFEKIKGSGVTKVIDVRLNNSSQLAGFAKRDDLKYFLDAICGCGYEHRPILSPTTEILDGYKNKKMGWPEYESRFRALMNARRPETAISAEALDNACLLCSEPLAHQCHRRLAAEYFKEKFGAIEIIQR